MRILIVLLIVFAVLLCSVIVVFPPSNGHIPSLRDSSGKKVEGSIAEKCTIASDGCDIGMVILSENAENPVLLVCGGGPGIPEYLLEYMYPSVLPEFFTVCYFDYRGAGLSFDDNIAAEDMTTEICLEDVQLVTDYLRERFSQEKIYIMGHSFGSYIAINTVKNHPEKYTAYFAMSQCTNQLESEYMGYDYMRAQYEQMNNSAMVKKFDDCPIRESDEMYAKYFSSSLRDKAMHELGVGTARNMKSVISGIFFPSLRCTAYTWGERINIWRGKARSNHFPVTADSTGFDVWEEVPSVQIPVYFFAGKYDYTCNFELQKKYYESLYAPKKEFYAFEESAHSPIFEEPDRAAEIFDSILK